LPLTRYWGKRKDIKNFERWDLSSIFSNKMGKLEERNRETIPVRECTTGTAEISKCLKKAKLGKAVLQICERIQKKCSYVPVPPFGINMYGISHG
jgi:hypothetical protein